MLFQAPSLNSIGNSFFAPLILVDIIVKFPAYLLAGLALAKIYQQPSMKSVKKLSIFAGLRTFLGVITSFPLFLFFFNSSTLKVFVAIQLMTRFVIWFLLIPFFFDPSFEKKTQDIGYSLLGTLYSSVLDIFLIAAFLIVSLYYMG